MTTKRRPRPYSELERLAIMIDALLYGERRAAQRNNVPAETISRWFRPLGGYRTAQQHINIRQLVAESAWRTKLFTRGIEELDKAHADTIFGLIVKVLETDAKRPVEKEAPTVSVTVSQQQAQPTQHDDDERYARLIAKAARIFMEHWPGGRGVTEAEAPAPAHPQTS